MNGSGSQVNHNFGANTCQVGGIVVKTEKVGQSVLLYVRYGKRRENTGQSTQFVNMAVVRVPPTKFGFLADVEIGSCIFVLGRVDSIIDETASGVEVMTQIVPASIRINDVIFDDEDEAESEEGQAVEA